VATNRWPPGIDRDQFHGRNNVLADETFKNDTA